VAPRGLSVGTLRLHDALPIYYADEMARLYRDRVRGEGPTSVWLALLADLARTAPTEQLSTLVQDVRHAWRTWRRTPVLALAAVLDRKSTRLNSSHRTISYAAL